MKRFLKYLITEAVKLTSIALIVALGSTTAAYAFVTSDQLMYSIMPIFSAQPDTQDSCTYVAIPDSTENMYFCKDGVCIYHQYSGKCFCSLQPDSILENCTITSITNASDTETEAITTITKEMETSNVENARRTNVEREGVQDKTSSVIETSTDVETPAASQQQTEPETEPQVETTVTAETETEPQTEVPVEPETEPQTEAPTEPQFNVDPGVLQTAYEVRDSSWYNIESTIQLINGVRAEYGYPQLILDERLCLMATVRSIEQAADLQVSHTRPDGRDCLTIKNDFNYSCGIIGEVCGQYQTVPEEIVSDWLNSPEHAAIIMSPQLTHIGIGVVAGSNGGLFWTGLIANN